MQKIISGLYATAPQPLPLDEPLDARAYLLSRAGGNVLIYSAATLADETAALGEQGGVARHYLGHWHEAPFGHVEAAAPLGAPLFCHESDRAKASERVPVAGSFTERHRLGDDLEAVPIPGHTPGSTAYLWDSGEHRCLFTADSVYLQDGEWAAAVLGSSDREAYIASLELLRELEFDLLVPWAASRGGPFHAVTDRTDARRRIDAIIERLRRGEDR
jgi:glyoxylase-like metal-dependent hydrolase (beta-lactamase superfamily II)